MFLNVQVLLHQRFCAVCFRMEVNVPTYKLQGLLRVCTDRFSLVGMCTDCFSLITLSGFAGSLLTLSSGSLLMPTEYCSPSHVVFWESFSSFPPSSPLPTKCCFTHQVLLFHPVFLYPPIVAYPLLLGRTVWRCAMAASRHGTAPHTSSHLR